MSGDPLERLAGELEPAPVVELVMPSGRAFGPVVRLVLGGLADRLDLRFEELDDLQLAVERVLVEGAPATPVRLAFEILPGGAGVRTRIGPLREDVVAALDGSAPASAGPTLRRVLGTVVDAYGFEVAGGELSLRLDKLTRRG